MTHSMSVSQFRSEFDDFLYASVDEGDNGTLLSVLSVLARLDIDPWQEAATLARMSRERAIQRLASLIETMPSGSVMRRDSSAIAAHLITFLPHRAGFTPAPRDVSPNTGVLNNSRAIIYVIILNMMFMAIALGSQFFTANPHSPAQVGHAHAPIAKTVPKVPSANLEK